MKNVAVVSKKKRKYKFTDNKTNGIGAKYSRLNAPVKI